MNYKNLWKNSERRDLYNTIESVDLLEFFNIEKTKEPKLFWVNDEFNRQMIVITYCDEYKVRLDLYKLFPALNAIEYIPSYEIDVSDLMSILACLTKEGFRNISEDTCKELISKWKKLVTEQSVKIIELLSFLNDKKRQEQEKYVPR